VSNPLASLGKPSPRVRILTRPVATARQSIRRALSGVLLFVLGVWLVFLLDRLPGISLRDWFALRPRTLGGLVGIPAMPWLHDNWLHILSNTLPLLVLLTLLAGSRARNWVVVAMIVLLGGAITWLIGGSGRHVGASGLVLGLVTFHIAVGMFEKRVVAVAIAILVGLLYGWTLIRNLVPLPAPGVVQVSYAGHWGGALAGVAVAYLLTRETFRANRYLMKNGS
jgi:membrane associated rhomboid family serine protease